MTKSPRKRDKHVPTKAELSRSKLRPVPDECTGLRCVIVESIASNGLMIAHISEATGIPTASMHGFLSGDRGITFENLERLVECLGLELKAKRRQRMR